MSTHEQPKMDWATVDPMKKRELYNLRVYPYNLLFNLFMLERNTEVAFVLDGDIYVRFQTFSNPAEFKSQIKKMNPKKIEFGASYSIPPKHRFGAPGGDFYVKERNLIFDLDLSDYVQKDNDSQSSGALAIQNLGMLTTEHLNPLHPDFSKSWRFAKIAMDVVYETLRHDYGFKKIIFNFSGRRGWHCIVFDERARRMDTERSKRGDFKTLSAYTAVSNYFELKLSDGYKALKSSPYVDRVRDRVDKEMPFILVEQEDTAFPAAVREITQSSELYDVLLAEIKRGGDDVWTNVKQKVTNWVREDQRRNALVPGTAQTSQVKCLKNWSMCNGVSEIALDIATLLVGPRLDKNVTKSAEHLMNGPLSIHCTTNLLCVAIDPLGDFFPQEVPHIDNIMEALDRNKEKPHEKVHDSMVLLRKGLL